MRAQRILIIEKNEALAAEEAAVLEEAGYRVARARDALDGLKKLYEAYPDLIIMDMEFPSVNGVYPLLRIREVYSLPIIALGGREEVVNMLELGADAFMIKPPDLRELLARVRSLLRRKSKHEPTGEDYKLEIENHRDIGGDGSNGFTQTEYRLASCMIINNGRLLDYPRLISEVWGGKEVSRCTLHFYMRRLRRKLADVNIFGVRGIGYCCSSDGGNAAQ